MARCQRVPERAPAPVNLRTSAAATAERIEPAVPEYPKGLACLLGGSCANGAMDGAMFGVARCCGLMDKGLWLD